MISNNFFRYIFYVGLCSSFASAIFLASSIELVLWDGVLSFEENKTALYYVLHGTSILTFFVSIVWAFVSRLHGHITKGKSVAYAIMSITVLFWFLITMIAEEKYTLKDALGSTGFAVWIVSGIAFCAVDEKIRSFFDKRLLFVFLLVSIAGFLYSILVVHYERFPGASSQLRFYILFWWLSAYYYLSNNSKNYLMILFKEFCFLLMVVGALYIQSRSWLLLSLIIFFIRNKYFKVEGAYAFKVIYWCFYTFSIMFSLVVAIYLFSSVLGDAVTGLLDRLDEDSRSNQYYYFFESVDLSQLVLGLGPLGTWYWPGRGDYQYIDNGLLWILFIGGIPLFISYIYFVFSGVVGKQSSVILSRDVKASRYLIILYGLMLCGLATFISPSLYFHSIFLYFILGRYWIGIHEKT